MTRDESAAELGATPGALDLERFRESGDVHSLLLFIRAQGKNETAYADSLNQLKPVFEALHFGLRPVYRELNAATLRTHMPEVTDIVAWMAGSPKADMKTRAIELMGHLGWESFHPMLQRHLASPLRWEQLTAISALGQVTADWAPAILKPIAESNPDPELRAAAQRALNPHT